MRIGFIGAGKVGFSLGKYFAIQGACISGYYSQSKRSAVEAAEFCGAQAFDTVEDLVLSSEQIFLTVPDGKIATVWNEIAQKVRAGAMDIQGKMFFHCSGALSSEVFEGATELGAFCASLHPLFAVSSKYETYRELHKSFFAIEGSQECIDLMVPLLEKAGNDVQIISASSKVRYHAAAVMASNQVIALYRSATRQLEECGFSAEGAERALAPLFIGNAQHIIEDGTVAALTGPAERGDNATIEKHLACLEGEPKEIYRLLTNVLYDIAEEKHSSEAR